ncbi:hypothetical protein SAMN05216403_11096 [Nitrosospira multiformis ATCC 25196]|uniref:Uncharacterized protein n=1 Tax=Nitrosospira multiformis (strain ATCC 25196 / NCIMB 11849 / C 71) TaxID=323848 RepID=A0A1H5V6B5_NITMU|nr:hypothetical protein SAMN05216403_11096 [Nitrosospira multiformis ATCC 25196]
MPSFTFCVVRRFVRNVERVKQKPAGAGFERKWQLPSLEEAEVPEAEEQSL